MLNILANSFVRATYQEGHIKPRWTAPLHWREARHYAPKVPSKEQCHD